MSYLLRSVSMSGICTRSLSVNLMSWPLRKGVGRKLMPQRCDPVTNSTAPLLRSMGSSAIHTEAICQPFTGQ